MRENADLAESIVVVVRKGVVLRGSSFDYKVESLIIRKKRKRSKLRARGEVFIHSQRWPNVCNFHGESQLQWSTFSPNGNN